MANIIQINGKKVKDVNAARMSSLAPVESSTTASMAHAVGDYFWLNGTLYEATAAITVGNAISVGTNCKITSMGENLADLKSHFEEITVENTITDETELTAVSVSTTQKTIFNTQYNRVALSNDSTTDCKVFEVTAGKTYKIFGFGNGSSGGAFAVVGDADIITSGASYCTLKQNIVPTEQTLDYHTVTIEIEHNGYVYVNHKAQSARVWELSETVSVAIKTDNTLTKDMPANAASVGAKIGIHGVIKNGNKYTCVYPADGEFVGIIFDRTGINELLDWDVWAYGLFDGDTFTPTTEIFNAYTDITGPFSIGQSYSQGGQWAGGYHSKTVDNVACKTAEQTAMSVYVNGVDITAENNGFYDGDVVIETTNVIYFPQTIQDNLFTNAVQAIEEKRRYTIDNGVKTEVIAKTLTSVYVSLYYGMQLQTNWATQFIVPSSDVALAKTDITADIGFINAGHEIIVKSVGARIKMILCDDGIGTIKYNNESDKNKIFIMKNGAKAYFVQVRNKTFDVGTYLCWNGYYNVSKK